MSEENKTIKLEDKELQKVASGDNAITYKYIFTDKDWIFENNMKSVTICILENMSTNDDSRKIRCMKRTKGNLNIHDDSSEISYTASELLKCYQGNGGVLNAM